VGSCAQIGKKTYTVVVLVMVFLAIAAPVIIEDGAFIGSRCIVAEGSCWERSSSCATVCLTASTKIDVTGESPVEMKGFVPARSSNSWC
jgi:2,3,4,5-tetrahydropyridine-2-carboxylate N-succinyltransferase